MERYVTCVNNKSVEDALTVGRDYEIMGQTQSIIFVLDDKPMDNYEMVYGKNVTGYSRERFVECKLHITLYDCNLDEEDKEKGMKVKVNKCSKVGYWYSCHIGKEFEVVLLNNADHPDTWIKESPPAFVVICYDGEEGLVLHEDGELVWDTAEEETEAEEMEQETPVVNNKYKREIKPNVWIDVYEVINAFKVTDPCLQHAIKKLLAAGERGHKDRLEDLNDIVASTNRAIEMHKEWS